MGIYYAMSQFVKVSKSTKGQGVVESLVTMGLVIGTLTLFIIWFVLNANNFQLQTALNLTLKKAMVEGYLSPNNITTTKGYLASVGLTTATITGTPLIPPSGSNYGDEIQVTITSSSIPLPTMDSDGHAVPDTDPSRSTTLTATGYIVSQYVP